MINGVDEVLILLFTAYGARVLVLKVPSRAFKSEEKDSNCRRDTRQKEAGGQTKNIWREKNVRGRSFRVYGRFKVSESDVTERTFSGSKVCPAQTTSRQLSDKLNYIYMDFRVNFL